MSFIAEVSLLVIGRSRYRGLSSSWERGCAKRNKNRSNNFLCFAFSDPRNKPRCQLFEGDLCLDEGDKAVVNHKRPETDMKRNVIRVQKKLWPNKVVYYSVDENLSRFIELNVKIRLHPHTC